MVLGGEGFRDLREDASYVFKTRIIWRELNISGKLVRDKYQEYFGQEERYISESEGAREFLLGVIEKTQNRMLERFKCSDTGDMLVGLFAVLDGVYHFYAQQKEARRKLKELNIADGSLTETFAINRNIARNIIDATNVWIENCLLHEMDGRFCASEVDLQLNVDSDMLLDLDVYGLSSQALSLITLSSGRSGAFGRYVGLQISPLLDIPAEPKKAVIPMVYFNPLITGNQGALSVKCDLAEANSTEFGIAFSKTYNVEFLNYIAVLTFLQGVLRSYKAGLATCARESQ